MGTKLRECLFIRDSLVGRISAVIAIDVERRRITPSANPPYRPSGQARGLDDWAHSVEPGGRPPGVFSFVPHR